MNQDLKKVLRTIVGTTLITSSFSPANAQTTSFSKGCSAGISNTYIALTGKPPPFEYCCVRTLISAGEATLGGYLLAPALAGGSIPPSANVPCTPHRAPAGLTFGGSGHANATNACPTRSASDRDLRDHAVLLMNRSD